MIELEHVVLLNKAFVEGFHVDVCLLTHHEHGYSMVGLNCAKSRNVRGDELENEVDVVSTVQIRLFKSFKGLFLLPSLVGLLKNGVHVGRFTDVVPDVLEIDP